MSNGINSSGGNNSNRMNTKSIVIIAIIVFILVGSTVIVIMAGNRPIQDQTTRTVPPLSEIKGKDPVSGDNHLHAIWYSTLSTTFFFGTHKGLYLTKDANNWTRHEVLGDTDVMSITANRKNPNEMLVAGHSIGVMRTTDGGTNFSTSNNGLPNLDVHVIASDPNDYKHVCAFVVNGGVFCSNDGAQKWVLRNDFVDGVAGITFDPVIKDTMYLATYNYGFMVSSDDGKLFLPSNEGLATTDVAAVIVNPKDRNEIMISVYESGLYLSTDGGKKWQRSEGNPREQDIVAFYEETPGSGRIYAGSVSGTLYYTTDFGRTWTEI